MIYRIVILKGTFGNCNLLSFIMSNAWVVATVGGGGVTTAMGNFLLKIRSFGHVAATIV